MKSSIAGISSLLPPSVLEEFLQACTNLAAHLAANIVEERLRGTQVERYATARENPLGSASDFRKAAAAAAFPTFRRGKGTAAKWSDVEAYMTSRPARQRKSPPSAERSLDDMLAEAAAPRRSRKAP